VSAATASAPPRYRVENIPAELVALPRWCVFQITQGPDGKTKKLPLIAGITGKAHAKNNDPRTWRPFDVALADAEVRGLCLAFVFDRDLPYFFLDADHVVAGDGTIRPDVVLLRDQLDTYTEFSASRTGLHIIGWGAFPERSANRPVPEGCKSLERYPLRGPRFCIFTGDTLPGLGTIEERGNVLAALFPPRTTTHANGSTESAGYRGPAGELSDEEAKAIIEWAAPLWTDGRRHHMALYLSGELGRQGVSREQAAAIIERCAADDSDPGAKLTACHDTYDDLEAGADVSGWYGLKDVCGLSDDELAPLSGTLDGFWKRHNGGTITEGRNRAREKAKAARALITVPEYPVSILPPAVRDYVVDAAASLSAPPEMVADPMMGFAGSVIGNRLHLILKNSYREFPTFYIAIVAPPGSAKTPALNLAQWPLDALQNDAEQVYRERKARYEDDLDAWRQTKDHDKPMKPQLRDYFSSNLTLEALIGMFDRAPGVAIIRDEILGWVSSMDQYRAGKGSDRQEYLALWSAKTIKLDRKGAEPIYRRYPVCCVVGGIQPDLVGGLHNEAQQRDGFVERLLPIVPDTKPMPWTDDTISTERYAGVLTVFQKLDKLPAADLASGDGNAVGVGVHLSTEARRLYVAWFNENARLVADAEGLAAGFYSKLPAHVARFALVLHALWNPEDPRVMVSAERMEDAIELGEFHRAHIGRFLALLKAATPSCHAGLHARIMRIMRNANQEHKDGWVTRSTIYRHLRNATPDDLTAALTELVDGEKIERQIDAGTTKPIEQYRIRISHYSHYPNSEAPKPGESTNTANNANGVEHEIERVASILRTFTAEDLAGFRIEVAAAHDDPSAAIDRAALALLETTGATETGATS
jgi:putative DNA primase/helicase